MNASEARVCLGFPPNTESGNARYNLWRLEVVGFMQMQGYHNSIQAGTANWQKVKDFAIGHRLTHEFEQAYNGQDGVAGNLQRALDALLMDIWRKEALRRTRFAAEEGAVGNGGDVGDAA